MYHQERESLNVSFLALAQENWKYLRTRVFKPYLKMLCIRMIKFYQKHISRHTCMFRPTCSQYTLECIENHGVIIGILLGIFRIMRCTPWTKPGTYDPPPELFFKKKWLK